MVSRGRVPPPATTINGHWRPPAAETSTMITGPIATRSEALTQITSDLDHFALAPSMRAKVSEHYLHLEHLATSLKTLGLDDEMIDQHVIEIFLKYKNELLRNIEKFASS
jgi:hypothetical protein